MTGVRTWLGNVQGNLDHLIVLENNEVLKTK